MSDGNNLAAKTPTVSIIVPVYNVKPYLRRCIDSLINQTLQSIEIILIDDGSTDGCGAICDEYAANDARVRVVHQENAGLSEARNAGIDQASADYLMFVDSDDWVEPDFCKLPWSLAKTHKADLVMFQYRQLNNNYIINRQYFIYEGIKPKEDAINLLINGVGMAAWNKLYHRMLFRKNRYPRNRFFEDHWLTPVLVHEARRIVYSSAILYNYNFRKGSITTYRSPQYAQDLFDAIKATTCNLMEWRFISTARQYYQDSILYLATIDWNSRAHNTEFIKLLRGFRHCPEHYSLKKRCKFYLCILSPRFYRSIKKCLRLFWP